MTLTDTDRAILLTPCECGHTINDHGSLGCWHDDERACGCEVTFDQVLCERVDQIVTRLTHAGDYADPTTGGA